MKKTLIFLVLLAFISTFPGCEDRAVEPDVPQSAEVVFTSLTQQREPVRLAEGEMPEAVFEKEVYGYRLFLFEDREESQTLRAGMQTAEAVYDLGAAGLAQGNDIAIEEVEINGQEFIRILGSLGANYAQSAYFVVEQAVPRHILTVEGHAVEADPDGDGRTDILGFAGTASMATLYEITGEGVREADLNTALGAVSITYTEDGRFEAYFTDYPNKPFFYRFDGEKMQRAD